jgi:hypothetical protein
MVSTTRTGPETDLMYNIEIFIDITVIAGGFATAYTVL